VNTVSATQGRKRAMAVLRHFPAIAEKSMPNSDRVSSLGFSLMLLKQLSFREVTNGMDP
jgi:hypothetical protein